MDKNQLSTLLDRIYELEGLVHLALSRDDNPDGLSQLIARKAAQISESVGQPDTTRTETPDPVTLRTETPRNETPDMEPAAAAASETAEVPDYDDEEEEGEVIPPEFMAAIEPYVQQPPVVSEATAAPRTLNDDTPARTLNDEAAPKVRSVNDSARGRLVFSLNDKFRFRRSLFDGDGDAFGRVLAEVAAMESYDEAEDYFYNEMQWQAESDEVKDFMEIIKCYFES